MSPFLDHHGLFSRSHFERVAADPRTPCPRTTPDDIDQRLSSLVELWERYRPSLVEPVSAQGALFGAGVLGLPRVLRPLPKSQEAVSEGFVELVLEQVCGYHLDKKPPVSDPSTGSKLVPDFLCFATDIALHAAAQSRGKHAMPDARVYAADAQLVVDAKRFAKGVGADEGNDAVVRGQAKRARAETSASEDIEQVLGYLRATGKRWGVLTNGRSWRLMEAGKVEQHLRFDLVLFAESLRARRGAFLADDRDTLTFFLHLFGPPATSGGYLDLLARESEAATRRVREVLRDQAHEAVSQVANGFLLNKTNGLIVADVAGQPVVPTQTQLDHIRELSLVFLYRLLFVLKAEALGLLKMTDPNGGKSAYARHASTQAIFDGLSVLSAHERTESSQWFARLRDLFRLVDVGGDYEIHAYDGGLFSSAQHPELERLRLHDDAVHALLTSLIYLDADAREAVPYKDLDVRDLGDIYEGLLELRLSRDEGVPLDATSSIARPFVLRNQDGEKKASGSYFTPDMIVDHVVRRTLQPLLDECGDDATRILALKVVDPAMGSGHFLVKAVDVIAWHLTLRCTPLDPRVANDNGPQELAYWKRRVVERCIYGVDVNPMAVELAKVALWLHTASAGKPLSFLDHHLKCGNALVGARLDRMNVPALVPRKTKKGDAWEAQASGGDSDKRRNGNVEPSTDAQQLLVLDVDAGFISGVLSSLHAIVAHSTDQSAEVHAQAEAYRREVDEQLACHRLLADVWCAQWFLATPDESGVRAYADPNGLFHRLHDACRATGLDANEARRKAHSLAADDVLAKSIRKARDEGYGPRLLRFFHWELEFPEVAFDEHGARRESLGFDAVVGNPPWDKLKPAKRDFYARFSDDVANTQGPSLDRLIERLQATREDLRAGWRAYEKQIVDLTTWLSDAGEYAHQSALVDGKRTGGDPDLFRYFVERAHQLARQRGRIGQVVPSTLWAADGCTGLRRLLFDEHTIDSLFTFENYRKWAFDIDSRFKFSVFVVSRAAPPTGHAFPAAFILRTPRILEGGDVARVVSLSRAFIDAASPGTLALLDVRHALEATLIARLHAQHPALGADSSGWNVRYRTELHMTNDAWLFRTREWLRERGFTQVTPTQDKSGAWTQRRDGPGEVAGVAEALPDGGEYWIAANESYYRKRGYAERSGDVRGESATWFLHPSDVSKNEEAARIFAGEQYTALYEGRMVHNFDHAQKAYVGGEGRKAVWAELDVDHKCLSPRVFVAPRETGQNPGIRCGFCDITGATNERTMLAALLPSSSLAGNKVPTLRSANTDSLLALVPVLASFTWDALIRLRVTTTLNWIYVSRVPVPSVALLDDAPRARRLRELVARLSCTTPELADVWCDVFPDSAWTYASAEREPWARGELRAELDAIVADLYGLSVPEYAYVLTTFPLLDRDQPALPGDLFATEGSEKSKRRGARGEAWEENEEGIVELTPRSFVTRDLALLRYMERKSYPIPQDLESFYRENVGIDPHGPLSRFRVGTLRDLEARVAEAKKRGAVAYVPSGRGGVDDEATE